MRSRVIPFAVVPSAECDGQKAQAACSQAGLCPAAIAHTPDKQSRQCFLPVQWQPDEAAAQWNLYMVPSRTGALRMTTVLSTEAANSQPVQ